MKQWEMAKKFQGDDRIRFSSEMQEIVIVVSCYG